MRILAGAWRARALQQPKTTKTRPMTDKVRATIFDVVGDVTDAIVLDAYAGSGAVGLEALSRGAAQVTAIESARQVAVTIRANATDLGGTYDRQGKSFQFPDTQTFRLVESKVEQFLADHPAARFDLIVADPPYEQLDTPVLEQLGRLLVTDGILVVSATSRNEAPVLKSLGPLQTKTYGDTRIHYYRQA